MDIMTLTTHAWFLPHVSADMQTVENPSSFFAHQPSHTLIDLSVACILLLLLPRSFLHLSPVFTSSDRRPKTRRHISLLSHSQNKIFVTLSRVWFAVCCSLPFLFSFMYNVVTGEENTVSLAVTHFEGTNFSYYRS